MADIIRWKDMVVQTSGSSAEEHVSANSRCMLTSKTKTIRYASPLYDHFESAINTCHSLGGSMPLPKSFDESKKLVETAYNMSRHCGKWNSAWLPIIQNGKAEKEGTYRWVGHGLDNNDRERDKAVTYLPWRRGEPNGMEIEKCVKMGLSSELLYSDVRCTESRCWYCSFKDRVEFRLRGLPSSSSIDPQFTFEPDNVPYWMSLNMSIVIEGYLDHYISYDDDKFDGRWNIFSHSKGKVGTLLDHSVDAVPFGKRLWNITTENEGAGSVSVKRILKLSRVSI